METKTSEDTKFFRKGINTVKHYNFNLENFFLRFYRLMVLYKYFKSQVIIYTCLDLNRNLIIIGICNCNYIFISFSCLKMTNIWSKHVAVEFILIKNK